MEIKPEAEFKTFIEGLKHISVEPKSFEGLAEIKIINLGFSRAGRYPPHLDKMPELEELNLASSGLNEIEKSVYGLKNLRKLNLVYNEISKIDKDIQNLTLLEEFTIGSNRLKELPDELGLLEELTLLNFTGSNFTHLPLSFGKLHKLKHLALWNNDSLATESICQVFSNYDRPIVLGNFLEGGQYGASCLQISLSSASSLPKEISLIQSLKEVHFPCSKLERVDGSIFDLRFLLRVELRNNYLKEIPAIQNECSGLRILDLRCNFIEKIPLTISNLRNLVELRLHGNRITTIPKQLCDLDQLTLLDLSDNGLVEVLPEIGNLSSIEELNLSSNKLTALPVEIGKLKNLKNLWLVDNHIDDSEREKIKNLLPDCFVLYDAPYHLEEENRMRFRPYYPILKKAFFVHQCDKNNYFLVKDANQKEYHIRLSGKQRINYIKSEERQLIYFSYDTRTTEGHLVDGTYFKMSQSLLREKAWIDKNNN